MIILLTGCINPNGMTHTFLNDAQLRKAQYIKAIKFYLRNTNIPVVFTENSGIDIKEHLQDYINSGRFECLSFFGNQDKKKGKGYGECEIIQYALCNSKLITNSSDKRIIKITGRLIINNINTIIRFHSFFFSKRTTFCSINSDFSFPDSRFIVASIQLYSELIRIKECINDSKGFYFEHALNKIIKERKDIPYSPFMIKPSIIGSSGSTGEIYIEDRHSISCSIKYLKYTISQLIKFKKKYR